MPFGLIPEVSTGTSTPSTASGTSSMQSFTIFGYLQAASTKLPSCRRTMNEHLPAYVWYLRLWGHPSEGRARIGVHIPKLGFVAHGMCQLAAGSLNQLITQL